MQIAVNHDSVGEMSLGEIACFQKVRLMKDWPFDYFKYIGNLNPEVLSRDVGTDFAPQGTYGNVWRHC